MFIDLFATKKLSLYMFFYQISYIFLYFLIIS